MSCSHHHYHCRLLISRVLDLCLQRREQGFYDSLRGRQKGCESSTVYTTGCTSVNREDCRKVEHLGKRERCRWRDSLMFAALSWRRRMRTTSAQSYQDESHYIAISLFGLPLREGLSTYRSLWVGLTLGFTP